MPKRWSTGYPTSKSSLARSSSKTKKNIFSTANGPAARWRVTRGTFHAHENWNICSFASASNAICIVTGTMALILPIRLTTTALANLGEARLSSTPSPQRPMPSRAAPWSATVIDHVDRPENVTFFFSQLTVKTSPFPSLEMKRLVRLKEASEACARVLFDGPFLPSSWDRSLNKRFRSLVGPSRLSPRKWRTAFLYMGRTYK